MKNLSNRISNLEFQRGSEEEMYLRVASSFGSSADGGDGDAFFLLILGTNEQFNSEDYETEEALWTAASKCHQRVHGHPINWRK